MELRKEYLILLLFIFYSVEKISANNVNYTTEKFQIVVPEKSAIAAQNKSIDKLVQEQTDLIKKIISNHKATTIDYPVVTKKEAEVKDTKTKEEKEQQSIEELRRCHELFKLKDGSNNNTQKVAERSETKHSVDQIKTVEAFGPNRKPEFLQKPKPEALQAPTLPPIFSNPSQVEQMPKKYFIVTRNRTIDNQTVTVNNTQYNATPKPQNLISQTQTVQNPLHENIKYVQLEPIILQKMILNNGRMLFYWYKNIPMIPQFVPVPKYQMHPPRVSEIQAHSTFKYPSQLQYPAQAPYQTQVLNNPYPSQTSYYQTYPSNFSQIPPPVSDIQAHSIFKYPSQLQYPAQVPYEQVLNNPYSSQFSYYQTYPSNSSQNPPRVSDIHAHSTFKYPSQLQYPAQVLSNPYPSQTSYYQSYPSNFSQTSNKNPSQFTNTPEISTIQVIRPQNIQSPPEQVPNYEIEYGTTAKPDDALYKKQIKFVIPVPYPPGDESEASTRYHPWQFDPYAYYPKLLQPSTVNVPLPYVPTFHMIRTLRIPDNLIKTDIAKSIEN